MQLRSSAFASGAAMPSRFTCDGEDLSPPLEWEGAPAETQSFVLLCDDPDAPGGTWHHWAAFDLPASLTRLDEGAAGRASFKQAMNDFRRPGYGGPCPPRGHRPHRYRFRLLAISTERLPTRPTPHCQDVENDARQFVLAEATLVGTYGR